jgi:glutamate synthase (NADPH/NADH) large chain/glutamate synthase (ferredoxin)
MASLGIAKFDDLIGRTDLLGTETAVEHWKARGIDLSALLASPELPEGAPRHRVEAPPQVLSDALDWELVEGARNVISGEADRIAIDRPVRNVNRCVGGILSSHIATARGAEGLADDSIEVTFRGSAGQSFGGWLAPGVSFTLFGDANDYTGKGLSGGVLAVRPPEAVTFVAEENQLIGNTVLYGATSGRAFFRGLAGERFAVRNSGAHAVVEGVGDHGCEYMTGGIVVVLGRTGRNFAAGMSGGLAFVLDEDGTFRSRVNPTMLDQLEEVDDANAFELRELISEHVRRTGSALGQRVLDDFDALRGKFVKVFPTDYKRVLAQWAAEEKERNAAGDAVSTGGEGFVDG